MLLHESGEDYIKNYMKITGENLFKKCSTEIEGKRIDNQ